MEHRPPAFILVTVPGCTFNLAAFSHAYPSHINNADLKIEFIKGGSITISDYSQESFNEALASASPPSEISLPL